MDFTPMPGAEFSANLEGIIDRAMQAKQQAETPRNYLGGSRLGEECQRKLGYEYFKAPKDPGKEFKGKTLRVFERGHDGEARMAARLRLAGFTLITEKSDGSQIGFKTGWDEDGQRYKLAGNLDGVITAAPWEAGLAVPALWENKVLGETSWKDTVRKGVRASKPVYYAQMQVYMAYLDLTANPGLFTAENGNTGEIYSERVPFDATEAQRASDRGVAVVSAASPEELPRIASTSTDFRCKFCDFAQRCWFSQPTVADISSAPAWGGFGKK